MNFLGIKQVLTIIFTLKIIFYLLFLDFLFPGLGAWIHKTAGAFSQEARDSAHSGAGPRVDI
jgi:hypothetical protein